MKLKQRDEGFVCDSQSIRRMELLILTTINWKMRSITPFSFLYFFISLFDLEDPPLIQGLRDRASEILFRSHYGNRAYLTMNTTFIYVIYIYIYIYLSTQHLFMCIYMYILKCWFLMRVLTTEIKILEYKPSIIAASALLCASQELFPLQFPCFRAAIVSCEHVNKVSSVHKLHSPPWVLDMLQKVFSSFV